MAFLKQIQHYDNILLAFIQNTMHNDWMDIAMPVITRLGDGGAVWIAIALIFIAMDKYRHSGIAILAALLLCALVGNIVLKPLVARLRPSDIDTAISLLIPRPVDFSFPSGHTMSSFAAATVIWSRDKRIGVFALLLAAAISFSRLYLYVHYPSDILGGMIIGVLLGSVCAGILNKMNPRERA